jgi:hypothetical protein
LGGLISVLTAIAGSILVDLVENYASADKEAIVFSSSA